jgi:hypothetical protein
MNVIFGIVSSLSARRSVRTCEALSLPPRAARVQLQAIGM